MEEIKDDVSASPLKIYKVKLNPRIFLFGLLNSVQFYQINVVRKQRYVAYNEPFACKHNE